ncbi:hypothetical protein [Streptomyces sp. NBC_01022]|uniref:hypothetical protein n=1 Tax=Streptomyces sp. NBC_01022 TaxID=2903723 RepID=UPI002DDA5CB4|nr:hypothetical protein [Streptomyces sp. NBC_01022]WRZ84825.1 hypothetical protein OG316_33480 [Streptomyces sp. NBC_01022]
MSPYLMSTSSLAALSDADGATTNELAAYRRSTITVAQAEQAAAVADPDRLGRNLLTEFRAAWSTGDHDQMTAVMLAAIDLDHATPDAPRLMDEIRGIRYQAAA